METKRDPQALVGRSIELRPACDRQARTYFVLTVGHGFTPCRQIGRRQAAPFGVRAAISRTLTCETVLR